MIILIVTSSDKPHCGYFSLPLKILDLPSTHQPGETTCFYLALEISLTSQTSTFEWETPASKLCSSQEFQEDILVSTKVSKKMGP